MKIATLAVAVLLGLSGCGAPEQVDEAIPFQPVLDDHQLMNWVMDPAADVIWGSAGYVITVEGEQDLQPTDDEGWAEVRNAAAVITESGNLLMLPGRSQGDDWNEFSAGIVTIGQRAMAAAEAQDADALFEVGGQLYNVCVACHQIYMLEEDGEAGL
ncbi:MAG: hypothetical protein GVY21_10355 [Gammaproteobacteria bacterium]|jgi:hypothetical protein|nr:hypothetical protein [Gammaproteobacteria bacterium]